MAGRGRGRVASLILRGVQVMNPDRKEDGQPVKGKLWPTPSEKDEGTMSRLFTDYTRGVLKDPAHRSAVEQATRAVYMAKSVDAADDRGILNTQRWRESMREVIGGVERYNGQPTLIPYGMDYTDFRQGVHNRISDVILSGRLAESVTPLFAARLHQLPLDAVGDGRYVLRSGDGVMVDKTGKPIVLNFNIDPPVLPENAPPTEAELETASRPATGLAMRKRGAS